MSCPRTEPGLTAGQYLSVCSGPPAESSLLGATDSQEVSLASWCVTRGRLPVPAPGGPHRVGSGWLLGGGEGVGLVIGSASAPALHLSTCHVETFPNLSVSRPDPQGGCTTTVGPHSKAKASPPKRTLSCVLRSKARVPHVTQSCPLTSEAGAMQRPSSPA